MVVTVQPAAEVRHPVSGGRRRGQGEYGDPTTAAVRLIRVTAVEGGNGDTEGGTQVRRRTAGALGSVIG